MQTGQENPLKAFVYFSKITLSLGKAIANQKAYIMANLICHLQLGLPVSPNNEISIKQVTHANAHKGGYPIDHE